MNISVVIPLYNKSLYIQRAINSVLRQKKLPDEILVVDDGSTDDSAARVKEYTNPRIRLIQQPNAGECAARNRGAADARNDLVAFLDADDEWKPDFLIHIQRLYLNFPDCGAYATAYEEILSLEEVHYPLLSEVPPAPWIGILPNLFTFLQVSSPFFPSSIAITKNVYRDLGGFPVGIKRGGDLMMWIKLGMKYPIAYSPSSQAIYHTEAVNRACVIFPSEGESAPARLIETMLMNQEVPPDLLGDIKDYYAFLQISKSKEMIKAGRQGPARVLLAKVKKNHKYKYQRLMWYALSCLPQSLLKIFARLRSTNNGGIS